jgi:flavin-dependent dehydrogenase
MEAYVTPIGTNEINLAFLWQPARADVRQPIELCRSFLAKFPALAARLTDAEPCGAASARGPMNHSVPEPACDGILLMGDAAGYVDALTGEGVGLAVAQALLLESTLVPLLKSGREHAPIRLTELKPFLQAARQQARAHRVLTKLLLQLARYPKLIERSIHALRREPELLRYLLSANQGRVETPPPLRATLSALGALLRTPGIASARTWSSAP